MDGVDRQVVLAGDGQRLLEPVQPDTELRRPAAVLEVRPIAGTGPRVDAQADGASRGATAVAANLADRIEVDVDVVGEEHVEVSLRDVRARCS